MTALLLACILLAPSAPQTEIGEPLTSWEVPDTATVVEGKASWYCGAGSRCTRGYPASGLYAAAGSALRVGDWRGRTVTVRSGSRSVQVKLIDWCFCGGGRVIDLYRSVFSRLGSPSRGVLPVQVSWGEGAPATLPPTSTAR
jgi:hypothetical protein